MVFASGNRVLLLHSTHEPSVLHVIKWFSVIGWLVLLVALYLSRPREAWFTAIAVSLLVAIPAIQFDERHFFYLAFLGWVPLGVLLSKLISLGTLYRRKPAEWASDPYFPTVIDVGAMRRPRSQVRAILTLAALTAALASGYLWASSRQASNLDHVALDYAPSAVASQFIPANVGADDRITYGLNSSEPFDGSILLLSVVLDNARCPDDLRAFTLTTYGIPNRQRWNLPLRTSSGTLDRATLPVFTGVWDGDAGVELTVEPTYEVDQLLDRCIQEVSFVRNFDFDKYPLSLLQRSASN
jgi:hypothetical protein